MPWRQAVHKKQQACASMPLVLVHGAYLGCVYATATLGLLHDTVAWPYTGAAASVIWQSPPDAIMDAPAAAVQARPMCV